MSEHDDSNHNDDVTSVEKLAPSTGLCPTTISSLHPTSSLFFDQENV